MEQFFLEHQQKIREYEKLLPHCSYFRCVAILNELYQFLKDVSSSYYQPNIGMASSYYSLAEQIFQLEHFLPQVSIFPIRPYFHPEMIDRTHIQSTHEEDILMNLTQQVREYLYATYHSFFQNPFEFERIDFVDFCQTAAEYTQKICDSNHLICHTFCIEPGFVQHSSLFERHGYHYFSTVQIFKHWYLIDCTYNQFFLFHRNMKQRIGIPEMRNCAPGTFMLLTPERKKLARQLLKYGFAPLNQESFKNYLDGFAISYRNGLYYEATKDFSFTTPYTVDDYLYFLAGYDNQLLHEKTEWLGYQERPLKNARLKIFS